MRVTKHEPQECLTLNRWRWCWRHEYPLAILSVLVIGVCALEIAAHEKTFAQVRTTLLTLGLAVPIGVWLLRRAPAGVRKWVIGSVLFLWVSSAVLIFVAADQPAFLLRLFQWIQGRSVTVTGTPNPPATAWPTTPIAVLIEHNPWLMVIGADTPRVELFEDGTLIQMQETKAGEPQLFVSRLTPAEMTQVRGALGPSWTFWRLKDAYNTAPNVTDLVTTELVVAKGKQFKRIQVYGYAPEDWKPPAYTVFASREAPDKLPGEFDRICKLLVRLKPRNVVPWQPRYVEVMIWPYEHSPEQPMEWPKKWPQLTDPMTFQRDDSYSLILPGSSLPDLREFLKQRGERQAVAIGGKKWSIAYRPVMPGGTWARRISERLNRPGA